MKLIIGWILVITILLSSTAWADSSGIWKTGYYVDEFNDKTGETYAYVKVDGRFSNSATDDSYLEATVSVDSDSVEFYLLEYGSHKLTSLFSDPTYTIRVKDGKDNVHTFSGVLDESVARIVVYNPQHIEKLQSILMAGGNIRFSITDDNSASTKYTFAINSSNSYDMLHRHTVGILMNCFSEGVATVTSSDNMGAINTSGEIVIPFAYDIIWDCSDGMLRTYNGEYTILGSGTRNPGDGKYGFISKDGTNIIECEFDEAYNFSCGRAFVKKDGKWGCIDTDGNLVIPYQYSNVYVFSEDIALVTFGKALDWGSYFYIDLNGNTVYTGMEEGKSFSNGLARVKLNGKYGYIDKEGNLVISATWDNAAEIFGDGQGWAISGEKKYIIDAAGNIIADSKKDGLIYQDTFSDGLVHVKNSEKQSGFVDKEGNLVIPCKFKGARSFQNNHAIVIDENGKYGVIDKTGSFTVPCKWDFMFPIGNYYRVSKENTSGDKKDGLIDANGNIVLDFIYDNISYRDGYYTTKMGSEWIIFDDNLNRVFIY